MAAEYGRGRKGINTLECRRFYKTVSFERKYPQGGVKNEKSS